MTSHSKNGPFSFLFFLFMIIHSRLLYSFFLFHIILPILDICFSLSTSCFQHPVASKCSYPPPRLHGVATQRIIVLKLPFVQNFYTSTLTALHYYVCNFKPQNSYHTFINKYIICYYAKFRMPCYASSLTTKKVKPNKNPLLLLYI
jgi:hypothetical protein